MRKLIFIILIVVLSVIYYNSTSLDSGSVLHSSVLSIKNLIKNSTNAKSEKADTQVGAQMSSQIASSDNNSASVVSLQNLNSTEFRNWIRSESKTMNSTNNDTDELQIRIKAQSQTLNTEQLISLKDMALDSTLPINDRIFSAFLIAQNLSADSQETLFNVSKSALPELGPLLPHSEAELKHGQELALRYMEVDELFQRAKTDANAKDKLRLLAQMAQSAQVRSYAEKKLKELK